MFVTSQILMLTTGVTFLGSPGQSSSSHTVLKVSLYSLYRDKFGVSHLS